MPCSNKFEWTYDIADPRDIDYKINELGKVHYNFGYWVQNGYNLRNDTVVECIGKYDEKTGQRDWNSQFQNRDLLFRLLLISLLTIKVILCLNYVPIMISSKILNKPVLMPILYG